jgi:hypothetical protein
VRNSSVGLVTRYGLDGPRIGPHCRPDISSTFRLTQRPTHPPVKKGYLCSFLGINQPKRDVGHPSPSIAMVKHERSYASTPHYVPAMARYGWRYGLSVRINAYP